jgi:hypothetical protein
VELHNSLWAIPPAPLNQYFLLTDEKIPHHPGPKTKLLNRFCLKTSKKRSFLPRFRRNNSFKMPRLLSQALAAGLKIRNNSSNPYQNTLFVQPYYLFALFPFLFFPFCFPLPALAYLQVFGPNDRGKPENKGGGPAAG